MAAAPYFAEVAPGPPDGVAYWQAASDGVRLRVGLWPGGSKGTVLIFPGRTEYVEKYADAARHLAQGGYASAAIDWRGQGLTERPARDRRVGHVGDFREFQGDVDALLQVCTDQGLPRPYYLLAHSMGGLIGLRSMMDRQVFAGAVFSAPMWGLNLPMHRRVLAWTASSLAAALGLGEVNTPASGKVADPAAAPFEGNLLTTDPEMFAWMKAQIRAHPELALGGPSLGWVSAALREMHGLTRRAAPEVPSLTLLGTDEQIVDVNAIHVRIASWEGATLEILDGLRHEPMMEGPETRARIFDRILAHFDHSAGPDSVSGKT